VSITHAFVQIARLTLDASRTGIDDHGMDSPGDPPLPLAGFRVLDLTRFLAGPYACRPGFDIMTQGVTRVLRMTGQPDGRPAKSSASRPGAYDKHPEARS
jgi:crotonobetainyl-CoA:carnitine CoA-transferase CaiB-like acyl-CoA transferase